MNKTKGRNILVTGSHRSGTTWIGRMVSLSDNVKYIHEPFNIGLYKCTNPFDKWFAYVNEDNDKYYRYINSFISKPRLNRVRDFMKLRRFSQIKTFIKERKKTFNGRILLKDPIAVMSAEWINKTFDADVICIIRHPAAFIASIKVKNWQFGFNDLLNQEALIATLDKDQVELIKEYSANKKDIIDQGILLWNIIYNRIYSYKEKYKDKWLFVRHEDVSQEPIKSFENIFRFLGINFTKEIKQTIVKTTSGEQIGELTRDSKKNIYSWKERLTESEVSRIKIGTSKVCSYFYSENEWGD